MKVLGLDIATNTGIAFLKDKIGFLQMSDIIENVMAKATFIAKPGYEDYVATDAHVRDLTNNLIIK